MLARARIIPFAFLMLSCTGEPAAPEVPAVPAAPVTITAELPGTRTAIGPKEGDAWPNRWSEGDAISINGVASDQLGPEQDGASKAYFTVSGILAPYKAGYPSAAFSNYSDGSATVRIAPEQTYVFGSYDPAAFVMTATATGDNIVFTPAVALFRLTVDCDPSVRIRSVRLGSTNSNVAVSGTFTTDFRTLKPTGGYRNYVTVSSQEGIPGGAPITFAIAPCDFSISGLQLEIIFSDGTRMARSATPSKSYKAGMMYTTSVKPVEPARIKVAYYNILRPEKRSQDALLLTNEVTYNALGRSILATGADLIGFGELDPGALPGGFADLSAVASQAGYTWKLDWPNDISRSYHWGWNYSATCAYSNGFAYNPSVLRLEDSGYVWLQKNGTDTYSSARSAYEKAGSPERTVVWARFTHILSGAGFWFFVTHLPTASQGGGENMAGGVNAFTAEKAGDAPSILAGDLNSADSDVDGSNSAPIRILMQQWTDTYDSAAKAGGLGDCDTYNGTLSGSSESYYYTWKTFTKNRPDRRLDHIMTRGELEAISYTTVRTTFSYGGKVWCPSDHLPVVATIVIN